MKKILYTCIIFLGMLCSYYFIFVLPQKPSLEKNWNPDQALLPDVVFADNYVVIHNVRDAVYRSTTDFDVRYIEKTVNINSLVSLDFLVEPFGNYKGPAHTLLTFGFQEEGEEIDYLAVSVEIRKEEGESFSPIKGLLRNYEMMYVVATEDDVIKLRTNHRKDIVYLYPIHAEKESLKKLFLSMMKRVNELHSTPEFYNTAMNNCTTNIVDHINSISQDTLTFDWSYIFPAFSDKFAYERGFIATDLSFDEAREKYRIDDIAVMHGDAPGFSQAIRSRR